MHGPVVESNPEILGGEPVFCGTREQAVSVLEMAREAAGREAAAG